MIKLQLSQTLCMLFFVIVKKIRKEGYGIFIAAVCSGYFYVLAQ